MVVLWALLTIFRIVIGLTRNPGQIAGEGIVIYIIPLLFMAVLNLFLGITLFFPQKKNSMWVLSVLVVIITLATLNFFQTKIDIAEAKAKSNYELSQEY